MDWLIQCSDAQCAQRTPAGNIVELIAEHRDADGWFICPCGSRGFIEKRFPQKKHAASRDGRTPWEPFLRGIIALGQATDSYQPFVFLVSRQPDGEVSDVWFSYYTDLRGSGGRLQVGYGPGGPPVMGASVARALIGHLATVR